MNVVHGYQVAPGRCHICASSEARPTIDTSADDLGHVRRWRVYICDLCVAAMFAQLHPTKAVIEKQKLADLEGELTAVSNEVTRLIDERAAWDTRLAAALRADVDA
jgi:hypothetical protein